jgi:hypothetical protein
MASEVCSAAKIVIIAFCIGSAGVLILDGVHVDKSAIEQYAATIGAE